MSASFLYEVASHVKNCHFSRYYYYYCYRCYSYVFPADFITGLLQNIGTHVDPIILIQKIREGMFIPGLRDSLVKILHDYNLQVGKL